MINPQAGLRTRDRQCFRVRGTGKLGLEIKSNKFKFPNLKFKLLTAAVMLVYSG
jgi:hypothetical protein